jgi:hypothetical protein
LDAVRAWLESYIQNGRTEGGPLPPCRDLRCFEEGPRRLPGNFNGAVIHHDSTFLFLDDGNHAILSSGNMLFCWCTGGGNWVPGMLNVVWKFQYKEAITSMAVLTSDMIVLGSCSGRLAVLSWKKVVRASFSCKPSPTLVEDWVSFSAGPLQEQLETPSPTSAMAILKLNVIAESTISGKLVIYRLVWVTSCGWVLSSTIEVLSSSTDPKLPSASETLIRRRKGCELYHATKPIRWKDFGGELVGPSKSMWVVPTKRIQVDNAEMALVWQKVEDDAIQVLAHHDQRVLGSAPRLAHPRCMNLKLQWMTMLGSFCGPVTKRYQLRTISIANSAGPITSIAIHPDQEWIVVGTSQNGILLVNARSNIPQLPSALSVG